jgi:protein-arginine kinase activator protein McsA
MKEVNMKKEHLNDSVLRCKICGNKPKLIHTSSLFVADEDDKYRMICETCCYENGLFDIKTLLYFTPESAIKRWNETFGN